VSQLLSVVRTVGEGLVQAIGAAPGIGRPRWEELKKCLGATEADRDHLAFVAADTKTGHAGGVNEKSDKAFLAVLAAAQQEGQASPASRRQNLAVLIDGIGSATITTARHGRQLKLELMAENPDFVSWIEGNAPQLITELHERWTRSED